MSDTLLRMYHRLPAPMRTMAATARGLYLRRWRYSRRTETLVREASDRERWSSAQWKVWQVSRLVELLDTAATSVPYYREHWRERRAQGDRSSWHELANWPILDKEVLRCAPARFIADGRDRRRLFREHTSGTTGTPIDLYRPLSTVRELYALSELRERRWYGVSVRDRWAILGGQLVSPVAQRRPPFWVWNHALNQLYMSSYHLAPALVPHYLDALHRYRIRYIWGYASALYALAATALEMGRGDLRLAVAITNAEPLFPYQRETIERAFQCPVRETYGMAELVAAASECEAGRLHMWPEVGVVEVHSDTDSSDGRGGELVCTGLLNPVMPLIRYRTGDHGAIADVEDRCGCGRTLPIVAGLHGRQDDVVYTSDGRRIGRLDPVFKARLPLREAQIVQESLTRIRVRFVPTSAFTDPTLDSVRSRLQARLGPVDVVFERVEEIPRTARGKFRAVICQLPDHERKAVGLA